MNNSGNSGKIEPNEGVSNLHAKFQNNIVSTCETKYVLSIQYWKCSLAFFFASAIIICIEETPDARY